MFVVPNDDFCGLYCAYFKGVIWSEIKHSSSYFIPLIHKHFHDLAQIFIGLSTYNGTQWPATNIINDNN